MPAHFKPLSEAIFDHDGGDDIIDGKIMMTMLRIVTTMKTRRTTRMTMMMRRRVTTMTTTRMTMMTSGSKSRADDF